MASRSYDPMRDRLAVYPEEYLECRGRRHWWKRRGKYQHRESGQSFVVIIFDCEGGCGADKWVWFTRDGRFVESQIHYRRGYLFRYTAKEREAGLRFTGRKVYEYEIRNSKNLEALPEE